MTRMWMIRAGKNAHAVDDFLEEGMVAMGNEALPELELGATRDEVRERVHATARNRKAGAMASATGQLYRFLTEIQVGEDVCTYDPGQRRYILGQIAPGDAHRDQGLNRSRGAQWSRHVARDGLTESTKSSLGSIVGLFLIPESAAEELRAKSRPLEEELGGEVLPEAPPGPGEPDSPDEGLELEGVSAKANELIEDALSSLGWEEMQELMAGVLRGMGYRTQVSPKGADRGVDVFASPDGLGLQEPRIFVEVKHRRTSTMGSSELRSFLGGRQQGDRCLYLSTGGFTREARYEAERSNIPITLIDLPRLRELILEHYDKLDAATVSLIPLQRIYWPSG